MKLNTNSNTYILAYASLLVIAVAFVLAYFSQALKPIQDKNVALDKKKQIIAALNIRDVNDNQVTSSLKPTKSSMRRMKFFQLASPAERMAVSSSMAVISKPVNSLCLSAM